MALKKSQIYSSLWSSCDELRGGMDASQYTDSDSTEEYDMLTHCLHLMDAKAAAEAALKAPREQLDKDVFALYATLATRDEEIIMLGAPTDATARTTPARGTTRGSTHWCGDLVRLRTCGHLHPSAHRHA